MNGPSSICQVQTSRPCEKDVTSSPATRKVHEIAGVPLGCSATACHSCIMWQDGSGVRSIVAYWILLAYWPKANVDHINISIYISINHIPKISQMISLLFHCGHQCTRLRTAPGQWAAIPQSWRGRDDKVGAVKAMSNHGWKGIWDTILVNMVIWSSHNWLVVWNVFLFFHILGTIIPTD